MSEIQEKFKHGTGLGNHEFTQILKRSGISEKAFDKLPEEVRIAFAEALDGKIPNLDRLKACIEEERKNSSGFAWASGLSIAVSSPFFIASTHSSTLDQAMFFSVLGALSSIVTGIMSVRSLKKARLLSTFKDEAADRAVLRLISSSRAIDGLEGQITKVREQLGFQEKAIESLRKERQELQRKLRACKEAGEEKDTPMLPGQTPPSPGED